MGVTRMVGSTRLGEIVFEAGRPLVKIIGTRGRTALVSLEEATLRNPKFLQYLKDLPAKRGFQVVYRALGKGHYGQLAIESREIIIDKATHEFSHKLGEDVLRHETAHLITAPVSKNKVVHALLGAPRVLKAFLYHNSATARVLEESFAKAVETGHYLEGLAFPFRSMEGRPWGYIGPRYRMFDRFLLYPFLFSKHKSQFLQEQYKQMQSLPKTLKNLIELR